MTGNFSGKCYLYPFSEFPFAIERCKGLYDSIFGIIFYPPLIITLKSESALLLVLDKNNQQGMLNYAHPTAYSYMTMPTPYPVPTTVPYSGVYIAPYGTVQVRIPASDTLCELERRRASRARVLRKFLYDPRNPSATQASIIT